MAPINQLGYGIASLNILKALQEKTKVSLFPIGKPQIPLEKKSRLFVNQLDAEAVRKGLETAKTFDPNAPCIKIWHQNQMAERIGSGKFIGFPIFELDTFDSIEKNHLSSCDELMVCSHWAKNVVMDQCPPITHSVPSYSSRYPIIHTEGKKDWAKVHVIPLGVDSTVFGHTMRVLPDPRYSSTVFFNCGKWEIRKGHDILIDAFKKAFPGDEDVQLWMMCENPFNSPDEDRWWHNKYDDPRVVIIPRVESQEEVYNIMRKADCGVFPARAEGWNLEALEMMAGGKQVIISDFSAHTEFCTEENSMLVTIDDTEIAYDGKWFHGQGNWAKIGDNQIKQIAQHMKNVHKRVQNHENTFNVAGVETAKKFSWQNSAGKIMEALNDKPNKDRK